MKTTLVTVALVLAALFIGYTIGYDTGVSAHRFQPIGDTGAILDSKSGVICKAIAAQATPDVPACKDIR
jgi:hypothetical protein